MSYTAEAYLWASLVPISFMAAGLINYFVNRSMRMPSDCHKYTGGNWGDPSCETCGKLYGYWKHHPNKLRAHKFTPHVRRDIGTVTKFCDLCNKGRRARVHDSFKVTMQRTHELTQESEIIRLEQWHNEWRLEHPEYEDSQYLAIFPEFRPRPICDCKTPDCLCPSDAVWKPESWREWPGTTDYDEWKHKLKGNH